MISFKALNFGDKFYFPMTTHEIRIKASKNKYVWSDDTKKEPSKWLIRNIYAEKLVKV